MLLIERVKEALLSRAAEGVAASVTVLIVWTCYELAPSVLPAIESAVSKKVILALLLSSGILNVTFLLVIWSLNKKGPLRLKYGIYWDKDKNPHCPSCKKPISAYDSYRHGGLGYYCKPCEKIFPLTDATGKNIEPAQAISEL